METRANHLLIGTFVLLATVLGFAVIYWMNGSGAGRSGKYYEVVFEGPVTGLGAASGVLFNGIKVGQVINLSIDPLDSRKTRALVSIDNRVPIRENSQARIQSQGLTGFAALQVSPGSPDAPLLIAVAGANYPVIRAELGASRSLMEAAPELMGNANALLLRLNKIVESNEHMITKAVQDIAAFTGVLDANKDAIGKVMQGASDATERIGKVATRLEKLMVRNEENLTKTVNNVASFTSMLDDNKQSIADLIDNAKGLSGRADQLLSKNSKSITASVRNVETITQTLADRKEDISGIVLDTKALVSRVSKATERLDNLIAKNEGSLGKSIANVEQVTQVLADNKDNIDTVLREATELTKRVSSAAQKVDILISENQKSVRNTLHNVEAFTQVLSDNKDSVGVVMRDAQEITAKFKVIADKMEKAIDGFSGFAGGGAESFMVQAGEAVKSFRSLAEKLDRSIGDEAKGIALVARRGLKEFDGFMRDGRRAVRNLDRVLDKIEKNPQSFIFGSKSVREYKSN